MEKLQFEYQLCSEYERSLDNKRWSNFTILISTSFLIIGFAFGFFEVKLYFKIGVGFAYLIFLTAVYYYFWFHRISHNLRDHLIELEKKMDLKIYQVRMMRPKFLGIKLYFHWAIILWIAAYTLIFIYFVIIC